MSQANHIQVPAASAAVRSHPSSTHVSAASHPETVKTCENPDGATYDEHSELTSDTDDDSESDEESAQGMAVSDRAIGVQVKRAKQSNKSKRARVFHACEPCRECGIYASSSSSLMLTYALPRRFAQESAKPR